MNPCHQNDFIISLIQNTNITIEMFCNSDTTN